MGRPFLKIITRESPLALAQVEEALPVIRPCFAPGTTFDVHKLSTVGDRDLKTSLADPQLAQDFFTRELDQRILGGEADLAIHSAKDLPHPLPAGIALAALLPARDIRDALVVRAGLHRDQVRVVGSSSPKRNAELARLFPAWELRPIRGTIGARLDQLNRGDYDAVVIAACALERLELADRIESYLPWDPTPNQGRLAITVREDRQDLIAALRRIDVREKAGLVALIVAAADTGAMPQRARQYLRQADVIVHDGEIPRSVLPLIGPRAETIWTPPEDIHRQLLHFAEQGKLVVRLLNTGKDIVARIRDESQFLAGWNIRVDNLTDHVVYRTLFTGIDPENFLKYGPLLHWPVIEVNPVDLTMRVDAIRQHLPAASGIIFPSRPSVRYFIEALMRVGGIRELHGKRLLAVGPSTQEELAAAGLHVDLAAPDFGGVESLVKALGPDDRGIYLYPCSNASPKADRVKRMKEYGIELHPLEFYRNQPTPPRPLPGQRFTHVLFTSSSTVEAYFARYPEESAAPRTWIAIGPSTLKALQKKGFTSARLLN